MSLLHYAAQHRVPDVIEYLLSKEEGLLTQTDSKNQSPLYLAAENGRDLHESVGKLCEWISEKEETDIVKEISQISNKATPHTAAANKNPLSLKEILEKLGSNSSVHDAVFLRAGTSGEETAICCGKRHKEILNVFKEFYENHEDYSELFKSLTQDVDWDTIDTEDQENGEKEGEEIFGRGTEAVSSDRCANEIFDWAVDVHIMDERKEIIHDVRFELSTPLEKAKEQIFRELLEAKKDQEKMEEDSQESSDTMDPEELQKFKEEWMLSAHATWKEAQSSLEYWTEIDEGWWEHVSREFEQVVKEEAKYAQSELPKLEQTLMLKPRQNQQ
eukprot:TRINITY_DN21996_c0_g1_i1.p1 TRINITY_DN21996_c0_g1~~TRINITY_DN21996_c0_g1_i1.p1  ORF type:complete len:378 (-),score=90.83 TRINITY_DN21996_c0_g1_i1:21-1010(-)